MAFIITLKVVPSAGQQKAGLDKSGALKIWLKSPPEDGKANKELIQFLSKKLQVAQASIAIISGATSRSKKIKINEDMSKEKLFELLGVAYQSSFLSS